MEQKDGHGIVLQVGDGGIGAEAFDAPEKGEISFTLFFDDPEKLYEEQQAAVRGEFRDRFCHPREPRPFQISTDLPGLEAKGFYVSAEALAYIKRQHLFAGRVLWFCLLACAVTGIVAAAFI